MKKVTLLMLVSAMILASCAHKKSGSEPPSAAPAHAAKAAAPAPAEKSGGSEESLSCNSGTDKRTITTKSTKDGGCEVVYDKFGKASTIASAASDPAHCKSVVSRIQENLKNAGYTCK